MIEMGGVGVDCFVCSANLTSPVADALGALASEQIDRYLSDGHQVKAAVQTGFSGLRIASMFIGKNDDYVICDIKGGDSDGFIEEAKKRAGGVQCSRIDCRVDASGFNEKSNPARAAAKRLESRNFRAATGRQVFTNLIRDAHGGMCFYSGAPASDCRNRLYDKHAESPDGYARGTFRWEHQARRERANNIWRGLTQAANPRQFCLEVVKGAFEGHGADMAFLEGVEAKKIAVPKAQTDADGFLRWFGRCVSPTLVKHAVSGHEAAVLAELERTIGIIKAEKLRSELLSGRSGEKSFRPRGSRRKDG